MFGWPTQRSESGGCGMRTRFPGFRPQPTVRGVFGDPKARVITLARRSKKRSAAAAGECTRAGTTARTRRVRDLSVRRHAHLPRVRGAARAVPELRQGEARAAGRSWPTTRSTPSALPTTWGGAAVERDDQGRGRGTAPRLGHGQGRWRSSTCGRSWPARARRGRR